MDLDRLKISSRTIESISEAVFPKNDFESDAVVELLIIIETPLIIREFNAYLRLADRIYGRMLDWNLNSYSHRPAFQLRINQITSGSSIISIIQELEWVSPLIIVCIALKYLADAFKTSTESVKNLSESYKNFREARYLIPAQIRKLDSESVKNIDSTTLTPSELKKLDQESLKLDEERKNFILNRKKLESELRKDEMLKDLDEKHLKQIPRLLKDLFSREMNDIKKARRFAIKNVKEVKIRKKKRK